ncbi:arsenate reductase family protein [Bifidobacterium asteroides]|uniref:arsenate reductase family protein n=1 Tax=Bifidobacterium asteroides TaxID=1684 RepID=UPI003A7FE7C4
MTATPTAEHPLFICYNRCSTCAKARTWLRDHNVDFTERDIKGDHPTQEELTEWLNMSGLPVRRFFNTSGQAYRSQGLSKRLPQMDTEQALQLLSTDGMLVKRPILLDGRHVLVGFRQQEWENWLADTNENSHNS